MSKEHVNAQTSRPSTGFDPLPWALLVAALAAMVGVGLVNYLLFHALAEGFCVVVACGIFLLVWNSRQEQHEGYFTILGAAYLCVGLLDLVHTLAYKGMGVFALSGSNEATQLWVAARAIEAVSLLGALLALHRPVRLGPLVLGYAALFAAVILTVFVWPVFPDAFVEGQGLTPFKILVEYAIVAVLAGASVRLWAVRGWFDRDILPWLVWSVAATAGAELAFTLYSDPYALTNLAGHVLKMASFYLLYRALLETGLRRPYERLRETTELADRRRRQVDGLEALRDELERRVAERTAVAERRARQLQAMALQLARAEQHERRRLARVLHDHLQQLLVAAKFHLSVLPGLAESGRIDEGVDQLEEILSEALASSRTLTYDLSPPILYDHGLLAALEWLARDVEAKHGLPVDVAGDDDAGPEAEGLRAFLFHAVRELLLNVVKHAEARTARIRLTADEEMVRLAVEDDGRGFSTEREPDEDDQPPTGFGLFSISERIELLGGWMHVDSAPGRGARVELAVPARPADDVTPPGPDAEQ